VKNGINHLAVAEGEAVACPGRRPAPWLADPGESPRAKAAPLAAPKGRKQLRCFRLNHQG
jgi:hypothetical protein